MDNVHSTISQLHDRRISHNEQCAWMALQWCFWADAGRQCCCFDTVQCECMLNGASGTRRRRVGAATTFTRSGALSDLSHSGVWRSGLAWLVTLQDRGYPQLTLPITTPGQLISDIFHFASPIANCEQKIRHNDISTPPHARIECCAPGALLQLVASHVRCPSQQGRRYRRWPDGTNPQTNPHMATANLELIGSRYCSRSGPEGWCARHLG